MTTLSEAAQQMLEAIERGKVVVRCHLPAMEALRAALAQPDPCEWVQDGDEESAAWQASCSGRYFMLEDGTPQNNRMAHCCYCGKTLVEVPFEREESDD